MTDEDFIERYRITSLTSRLYTYKMLLAAVSRDGVFKTHRDCGQIAMRDVAAVLMDDVWLRRRAGMIPARVVEDAIDEAHTRRCEKRGP